MKDEVTNLQYGLSFLDLTLRIQAIKTDTFLFVIDEAIWKLYEEKFNSLDFLKEKKVFLWVSPQGEESKTYKNFEACLEYFLSKGVHRNAHLFALGGGALSDFAGFVASSLLRGVNWSVIPTTLLAMIDAAIGGKTALNSLHGKNLIGSFHQPQNIWINFEFLKTLEQNDLDSGKGEIIKYAFLDKYIYDLIVGRGKLEKIIKACAEYKMKIVADDYFESNLRKILNLGHTFGHAFEKMYQLPHGVAVELGMEYLFEVFDQKEMLSHFHNVKDILLEKSSAPKKHKHDIQIMFDYLKKDKKIKKNDIIDLVIVEEIGKPEIQSFSISELEKKVLVFNMDE